MAKKVKKKLNKKGLLVVLLTLYLFIMAFYYCFNLPVKLVEVKGNTLISDEKVINNANITDKTKLFALSSSKLKKNLEELPMIESVKISKYLNGKVVITIKELVVLYYRVLDKTYVFENNKKATTLDTTLGIPTLVNYVPSDIEESLIKKLSGINKDILYKVSEIEYSPDIKNEKVIDKNRFLLRMNDGNYVYINLANINNLNKYEEIYATLNENEKGVLNLDSSSNNGIVFQTFELLKKKEEMQNELSE